MSQIGRSFFYSKVSAFENVSSFNSHITDTNDIDLEDEFDIDRASPEPEELEASKGEKPQGSSVFLGEYFPTKEKSLDDGRGQKRKIDHEESDTTVGKEDTERATPPLPLASEPASKKIKTTGKFTQVERATRIESRIARVMEYAIAIQASARTQYVQKVKFDPVKHTYKNIEKKDYERYHFCKPVILECFQQDKVEEMDVLRVMMTKLNELGHSGRADVYEISLELIKNMESAGIAPDYQLYHAAITACGNAGGWQSALKLLGALQQKKVLLDSSHYNAVMLACKEEKEWKNIIKIMEYMEKKQLNFDVYSCEIIISALENSGRGREITSVIINKFIKNGVFKKALGLMYKDAESATISLSSDKVCHKGMIREKYKQVSLNISKYVVLYHIEKNSTQKDYKIKFVFEHNPSIISNIEYFIGCEVRNVDIKTNNASEGILEITIL